MKKAGQRARYAKSISELQSKRPLVRLPPRPSVGEIMGLAGHAAYVRATETDWLEELEMRIADAVLKLAASNEADPRELMKVARVLVEIVPPETRGRPALHLADVFYRVASEIRRGAPNQQTACAWAEVDPNTFRKYHDTDPSLWVTFQRVVNDDAPHHPQSQKRK